MPLPNIVTRIVQRSKVMNELVDCLHQQIDMVKTKVYEQQLKRLRAENEKLKGDVEVWKARLIEAEVKNGVKQIPLPVSKCGETSEGLNNELSQTATLQTNLELPKDDSKSGASGKEAVSVSKKAEKKPAKPKKVSSAGDDDTKPVDVSRLDFRIGVIRSAKKHPDADSLYVEDVDVGEERPRTVVSGLVKYVPLEEMQNRMAVLLCNLKPAKMRGILSEAMVMCASSSEKVEILIPPPGCTPGERIVFEGFLGEPDAQLNPKKKIFEQVAPDLKTDENCIATYKGVPFTVKGKGVVKASSMTNANIK